MAQHKDMAKTEHGAAIKRPTAEQREAEWRKDIKAETDQRAVDMQHQRAAGQAISDELHRKKAEELVEYKKRLAAHKDRLAREIKDMLVAACAGEKKYKGKAIPEILMNIAGAMSGMVDRMAQDEVRRDMAQWSSAKSAPPAKATAQQPVVAK